MVNSPEPTTIVETFAFDGGRSVTVSLPSSPPEAIVYAGDGQLIAPWGSLLHAAGTPPTAIVGIHRTSADDEMVRLGEYSPPIEPERFLAHEAFVIDDVRGWVQKELGLQFPRERTAVCGVSAGGELSLALGMRHPEIFGSVFSMSPGGGYRPPEVLPIDLPRVYLTAGTLEPFFLENAFRWAHALQHAGADVMFTQRLGDHGDPFWAEELPPMVAWAFGE